MENCNIPYSTRFWWRNTLVNLANHWWFVKFDHPNFNNVLWHKGSKQAKFYSLKVSDGKSAKVFLHQTFMLYGTWFMYMIYCIHFWYSVNCAPGSFQMTEVAYIQDAQSSIKILQPICKHCPLGYYQTKEGQTSCDQCPPGYTTRHNGSHLLEDCYKECDNGYYSSNGLEPCLRCPNGTYSATKGSTTCQNCTKFNESIAGYCELPTPTSKFI